MLKEMSTLLLQVGAQWVGWVKMCAGVCVSWTAMGSPLHVWRAATLSAQQETKAARYRAGALAPCTVCGQAVRDDRDHIVDTEGRANSRSYSRDAGRPDSTVGTQRLPHLLGHSPSNQTLT